MPDQQAPSPSWTERRCGCTRVLREEPRWPVGGIGEEGEGAPARSNVLLWVLFLSSLSFPSVQPSPFPVSSGGLSWETAEHPPHLSVLCINLLVPYDAWCCCSG